MIITDNSIKIFVLKSFDDFLTLALDVVEKSTWKPEEKQQLREGLHANQKKIFERLTLFYLEDDGFGLDEKSLSFKTTCSLFKVNPFVLMINNDALFNYTEEAKQQISNLNEDFNQNIEKIKSQNTLGFSGTFKNLEKMMEVEKFKTNTCSKIPKSVCPKTLKNTLDYFLGTLFEKSQEQLNDLNAAINRQIELLTEDTGIVFDQHQVLVSKETIKMKR